MATPERPQHHSLTLSELTSELEDVEQRLEIADENENTIERYFKRDELLEQRDWLEAQIDEVSSPPEQP